MNPLGKAPIQVNPAIQNIAETIRFAKSFQSPAAFMQELQKQNPAMAQQLNQLSMTVKNPMQYATQMLSQQGISPQQLMSALQGKM